MEAIGLYIIIIIIILLSSTPIYNGYMDRLIILRMKNGNRYKCTNDTIWCIYYPTISHTGLSYYFH